MVTTSGRPRSEAMSWGPPSGCVCDRLRGIYSRAADPFPGETVAADDELDEDVDELEDELEEELEDELGSDDDDDLDDEESDDFEDGDDDADDDGDDDEDRDEALEELEAEELEIEDDPETILVDEAAEIREMRREELGLDPTSEEVKESEFVCTSCFLVKSTSQLANKSRQLCRDCV